MSEVLGDPLEQLIRESGLDWLIDWYEPRTEALPNLRRILERANASSRERLGANAPDLTADALLAEYRRNPHKVRAFFQVVGSVATPDILVMVWRILQGMNIAEVRLNYVSQRDFQMTIRLTSPYEEDEETYESSDIDDAVVLRHFGIMKMNDAPIFDGFYPLN